MELALNSGIDPMSGLRLGCETEAPEAMTSFEKLLDAVKAQLNHLIDSIANTINTYEKHYREISPAPLLSAASPDCLSNI